MFALIRQRMFFHPGFLLILTLGLLITLSLFALTPLYTAAIGDASLRHDLAEVTPRDHRISLWDTEPFESETVSLMDETLGSRVLRTEYLDRTAGGPEFEQGAVCGGLISHDPEFSWPNPQPCSLIYTYPGLSLADITRLVEGQYPEANAPDAPIQAVITDTIAELIPLAVGDRVQFGTRNPRLVEIVGIVEQIDSAATFWDEQQHITDGNFVILGDNTRWDFGMMILPEVYEQQIAPTTPYGTVYRWRIYTDHQQITEAELAQQIADHRTFARQVRQFNPNLEITDPALEFMLEAQSSIQAATEPVLTLAVAVLALMLFGIFQINRRYVQRQQAEWQTYHDYGASPRQMMLVQALTIVLPLLAVMIIAPFVAMGLMALLDTVGATARAFDWIDPVMQPLDLALAFSLIAGVLALVVTAAAVWIERYRVSHLSSQPAQVPLFAAFYLDIMLLLVGLGLLVRLYFITGANWRESFTALWQSPADFSADLLDRAQGITAFSDPLNLLAPLLLLVGVGLFLIRLLMVVGSFLRRHQPIMQGVSLNLFWMMAVALGIAALILTNTHNQAIHAASQRETGADVYVSLDPQSQGASTDWTTLPGVTDSVRITHIVEDTSLRPIHILALEPEAFDAILPAYGVGVLAEEAPLPMQGVSLPETVQQITLYAYADATESDTPVTVNLELHVQDAAGVIQSVPMETVDAALNGAYNLYTATIPAPVATPWRLISIEIHSRWGDVLDYEHRIFLDDITAVPDDGSSVLIEGFEDAPMPTIWRVTSDVIDNQRAIRPVHTGTGSLQIEYHEQPTGGDPILTIGLRPPATLPIIMSDRLMDERRLRTGERQQIFAVGDLGEIDFMLGQRTVRLPYSIVGTVEDFPTMMEDEAFMIVRASDILPILNAFRSTDDYFYWNEFWLMLEQAQPSDDLRDSIAALPGLQTADYAWDHVDQLQGEARSKAVPGLLLVSFAMLLAMGLLVAAVDRMMDTEPRWAVLPVWIAVPFGAGLGIWFAYLLLPFLRLLQSDVLVLPWLPIGILVLLLLVVLWGVERLPRNKEITHGLH